LPFLTGKGKELPVHAQAFVFYLKIEDKYVFGKIYNVMANQVSRYGDIHIWNLLREA